MKIILSEEQFRRVILNEQQEREKGVPIKHLSIIQPKPGNWFEQSIGYITKSSGIGDILVTSDMSTKDVLKIIKEMSSEGRAYWDKGPKVLYKNSLDSLYIGTHGGTNKVGCGKFVIDDTNGMRFLKYLSPFTKPTTKVEFTGCYTGNDPYFVSRMATALGVNEVIAATSTYYPGRWWDNVPAGYLISCPSIDKIKNKDISSVASQIPKGAVHKELSEEEVEKRIKQLGCKILN
jgi:hypothetical protein